MHPLASDTLPIIDGHLDLAGNETLFGRDLSIRSRGKPAGNRYCGGSI